MSETINGFWFGLGFSVAYCALNWAIYLIINSIKERRNKQMQQQAMGQASAFAAKETAPEPIGSRPH